MMERLKRWFRGDVIGRGANVTTETGERMDEELRDIAEQKQNTADMNQTQELLKESREKSREASRRLTDYQKRIQDEYERRAAIAAAGRTRDARR